MTEEELDDLYMGQAVAVANVAGRAGDVPVGAVIVIDGQVVATGYNRRQVSGDATAHAEIEALRAASQYVGNWRVEGTMYVTQEPCPMCAGALVNARIRRLVYGCDNPKAGAVRTLYQIPTDPRLNHRMDVVAGVRARECSQILSEFFETLRQRGKLWRGDREAEGV
jgi:tRNA(adenine34) deaminase